jgi:hypothetical protein
LLDPKALTDLAEFGVTALGTWRAFPIFVSESQYEDAGGQMKYYVPAKEVLITASSVQRSIA